MCSTENEQSLAAKLKLSQLLDYIAFQEADGTKIPYQIPVNSYMVHNLQNLEGMTIFSDEQDWFSIKRVDILEDAPELPEILKYYLQKNDDGEYKYVISGLKQLINFTPVPPNKMFFKADIRPLLKACEILKYCRDFLGEWQIWFKSYSKSLKSIKLYDQLFYWYNTVNSGISAENTEVVAGFGFVQCKLPSGKLYRYPLVTIPVVFEIDLHGVITVGPKDVLPRVELDAFLLEEKIASSGQVKDALKNLLSDNRFLDIFNVETFADVLGHFIAKIDSRASFSKDLDIKNTGEQIIANNAMALFARPHISSVIRDDVEALKQNLNRPETVIPEQPLSLVTPLSDSRKQNINIAFRGRSGVEGRGDEVRELYFPLPYNTEQVTIVRNMESNSGVVVQGPPGTGKTHTIANILSHYLALGKRVLVTAQQAHVLNTVHEKIPEKLRPLVISRLGSSQQSKRQLETNIDFILQNLSQINEGDLQKEVEDILQNIEIKHKQMIELDQHLAQISSKHAIEVKIGERMWSTLELTVFALKNKNRFEWFDSKNNPMNEKFDLELPDAHSYKLVKKKRRELGSLLRDFNSYDFFALADLPSPKEIESLALRIVEKNTWDAATLQEVNDINLTQTEVANYLLALTQHKNELSIHLASHSWVSSFFDIMLNHKSDYELLNDLVRGEMADLIAYRRDLLKQPINIPFEVEPNSKEMDALIRGAETGVLVAWYHFNKNLTEKMSQITISGQPVSSQSEWAVVLKFIQFKNKYNTVVSRWNALASQFNLFELELARNANFMSLLTNLNSKKTAIERLIEFFKTTAKQAPVLFPRLNTSQIKIAKWVNLNEFEKILNTFSRKNSDFVLSGGLQSLNAKIQSLAAIPHKEDQKPIYKRDSIIESLSKMAEGEQVEKHSLQYANLIKHLESYDQNVPSYQFICKFADDLESSGAFQIAYDIKTTPCLDMLEDPIIHDELLDALFWAKIYNYLKKINDAENLETLYAKRTQVELDLAHLYQNLASQKTWLSLKLNATDKTLVCLNRYKIAVQKIGKGTGKNAPRYRKDAQEALFEASQAIPCWIMSHYQVSETMPAEIGMFDLVIIDEASQSSMDVLPVLMRAKKILVVGDNKQVSPSNAGLSSERIQLLRDKYLYGQPHRDYLTPDFSLYDMASSIYDSSVMLLEHFRSHPNIISYSNMNFYDNKIKPMRISKSSERLLPPLEPIFVSDGKRETKSNKHINREEAKAIVAKMTQIIQDIRLNPQSKYKNKTIGAISLLGQTQAEYIQTQALDAFGAEMLALMKFACGEASSFQGAERDIIFLSMVADPENTYPLSGVAYEQRLNVAASRAREKMYLVHSVKLEDLSSKDLRKGLVSHFYTDHENSLDELPSSNVFSSDFEKELYGKLTEMGYQVKLKQRVGSYVIDLVVESDLDNRLAIECDGDSSTHDWAKDMLKQRDLERSGWVFWRCFWSTWEFNKKQMLASLVNKLEKLNIYPKIPESVE